MSRLRTLRTVSLLLGVLLMISIGPAVGPCGRTRADHQRHLRQRLVGWTAYPTSAVVDGQGCISVPAGTGAYGAAISQQVALQAGETYELSFDIASTPSTNGYVRVVMQSGPDLNYTQFLTAQKFAIPSTSTSKSFTFTASADYPNADVLFQQDVGNDVAYQLCLDNVSLTGGAAPEVYQPNTGPRVRVNQVGYLPDGPKHATLVTDATTPCGWECWNAAGTDGREGADPPRRRRRQLRTERRDHRLRRRPPLRLRLHAGRRRRDVLPVHHRRGHLREPADGRQDALLHPAQRHPDPRRAGSRVRPGGRSRRRRSQPGRHGRGLPAARRRCPEALRRALDLRRPA